VGADFLFRRDRRRLLRGGLRHEALRKQVAASHGDCFQIVEQRPPRHARRAEHFVRGLLRGDPYLFADGRLPLFHLGFSIRVVRPRHGPLVLPRLPLLQTLANAWFLPDLSRRC
jgi:hypothetical protein